MRTYRETVDVRRGLLSGREGPEQFIWRDRLWVVREVVAHWVETGAWWERATASAGALLAEREVWRVEANRGRAVSGGLRSGVFDLVFCWEEGRWELARVLD